MSTKKWRNTRLSPLNLLKRQKGKIWLENLTETHVPA